MRILTKMKYITLLLSIVFAFSAEASAAERLKIVSTVPSLASIAKSIGKDKVEVQSLSRHNEDPHYVSAKPSMIVTLNKADLLIVNGVELEIGWMPVLLAQARNGKIQPGQEGYIDASEGLKLLEVRKIKISRSMGDIHPGGNPHFIYSPYQMIKIADRIANRLASLDPSRKSVYLKNYKNFITELKSLADKKRAKFLALPAEKRRVVVYHNSLIYLFKWLKLEQIGTLEPKPGISPNPSHVSRVLKKMKANNTKLIVQEVFYPRSTSKTLAKMIDGKLLLIDGGPKFKQGEPYLNHLNRISEELYAALSK